MALPAEKDRYTYADLLAWEDGQRYELYDGEAYALASPGDGHQRASRELLRQFANFLFQKTCEVFSAPFDVRLFEAQDEDAENVDTVVQPDILVVCDRSKVDRRGVHGAPDLAVEILSDSSRHNDWTIKRKLYERAGVREYWIVDTDGRFAAVHTLKDGKYGAPIFYTAGAQVPVSLWEGFSVDLSAVFPE